MDSAIIPQGFFIDQNLFPTKTVEGNYQLGLVLLSYLIASIASFSAIYILRTIKTEDKRNRALGCVLGIAVCGIHYTIIATSVFKLYSIKILLTLFFVLGTTMLAFHFARKN